TDILPDRPAHTQVPPGQCPESGVNLRVMRTPYPTYAPTQTAPAQPPRPNLAHTGVIRAGYPTYAPTARRTDGPWPETSQPPTAPASVPPTSVRWKFWNERDAVGPRWPW